MNLRRLRGGELTALAGAAGLFVCLLLDWFDFDGLVGAFFDGHGRVTVPRGNGPLTQAGWDSLGWLAVILVAVALVLVVFWLSYTVGQQSPAVPTAGAVWCFATGVIAAVAVALRLVFSPDHTDTRLPAYLGLAFCLLIPLGAFLSLKDDRTGARESQAPEVELRSIPQSAD